MWRAFLIAICASVLVGALCLPRSHRVVTPVFYHWKTTVDLTAGDDSMLSQTYTHKLYVNFFDIVPNEEHVFDYPAVPGVQTQGLGHLPHGVQIVPVIYITVDAMKGMDSASIPVMADKICHKVRRFLSVNNLDTLHELQIDCDWTNSTRDKYFYLLSQIRERGHVPLLSATIRLYQYKYFKKAGVPPVDRGLLMFYHMNSLREINSKDMILDVAEGKKYMDGEKYPLPLDYALPLFSEMIVRRGWNEVHFYPAKVFDRLMRDSVLEPLDSVPNRYSVRREANLGDSRNWLGTWDEVRIERVSIKDLQEAADLLSAHANSDTFSLVFFHLDHDANSSYTTHEVKDIIRRFD